MKQTKNNKYGVMEDKARNGFYLFKDSTVKQIKKAETKNVMYNGPQKAFKRLSKAIKQRNSYKIYNY